MYEISCPSCSATTDYNLKNYIHSCPFCSTSFQVDMESGRKEVFGNHFIVPNSIGDSQCRDITLQWLKRIHHNPNIVEKDFIISKVQGFYVPFWVISLEVNTTWRGYIKKEKTNIMDMQPSSYVMENGSLRRAYRWAISAQSKFCDLWGFAVLHEPAEPIKVEWDGFPVDSTFSRGRVDESTGVKRSSGNLTSELAAYDSREYFDFKYGNGLTILPIEINEESAIERARWHLQLYHLKISQNNVHIPVDIHNDLDIAGVQLCHLPFWHVQYVYRPSNMLRYVNTSVPKNVLMEGYSGGILKSELSVVKRDKMKVNAGLCFVLAIFMVILGVFWHPSFHLVGAFFMIMAIATLIMMFAGKASTRAERAEDQLRQVT